MGIRNAGAEVVGCSLTKGVVREGLTLKGNMKAKS